MIHCEIMNDSNEIKCKNNNSIYQNSLYCIKTTIFYIIILFIVFFGVGIWFIIYIIENNLHNNTNYHNNTI